MGTDRKSSSVLKAACPICKTEIEAGTLAAMLTLLKKHCRAVKAVPKLILTPAKVFDAAKAPYTWVFPRNVESQNATTYGHWSVHAADKKNWMSHVHARMFPWQGSLLTYSVWKLHRVYKHPQRRLDHGNVVGSFKALIDCIRDLQIIRDDSDKHFECEYSQASGDSTRVELSLLSWTL
jgi:hypothetical protein